MTSLVHFFNNNRFLASVVIVCLIILGSIIFISLREFRQPQPVASPNEVPIFSPSPSSTSAPTYLSAPVPTSSADAYAQQAQADRYYGEKYDQLFKKYPWINSLPFLTSKYFVYFDTSSGGFEGIIYLRNGQQPTDVYLNSNKEEVMKKLKEIGVEVEQYSIHWVTKEVK